MVNKLVRRQTMGWLHRVACAVILLVITATGQAWAEPNQMQIFQSGINYYNVGADPATCSSSSSTTILSGSDNEQKAFNYFLQKGLSAKATAAVIGNLMQESHLNPTAIEGGGDSQNPADSGGGGWGIAQYTPGAKIIPAAAAAGITGPIYELATQLDLLWSSMSGPNAAAPTGYKDIVHDAVFSNADSSLSDLVLDYQVNFESGTPGARQQFATEALAKYGGSAANSGSSSSGGCASADCPATGNTADPTQVSSVRQQIVSLTCTELNLWKSQPNYDKPYPAYTYAVDGFLKYSGGSYEEWCADFVTWVYNKAGHPFKGDYDEGRIAYVPNLITAAQASNGAFTWHPKSENYTPQPGDLGIFYGQGHVAIFVSSTAGQSTFIGGDQNGVAQRENGGSYGQKSPPSGSIVSVLLEQGYQNADIDGYISPN